MQLEEKQVAILAEDLYEDLELWYPLLRMREAGAEVIVVGAEEGKEYTSKHGYPVVADKAASDVDAKTIDALVVPGGYAPDRMRRHLEMVGLVKDVFEKGGVVAFICHGGWVPISAQILKGKKATSFYAIKDDMINAGADWEDSEMVRDGNLISSRTPQDLPAFSNAIIEALA